MHNLLPGTTAIADVEVQEVSPYRQTKQNNKRYESLSLPGTTFFWRFRLYLCLCDDWMRRIKLTLANGSRLPRWFTPPPRLTRTDVSVELTFYTTPLRGPDAKFELVDRKWKKLAEVKGWTKETPSGQLRFVTEKGETETIKLMPCTEHECSYLVKASCLCTLSPIPPRANRQRFSGRSVHRQVVSNKARRDLREMHFRH